VARVKIERAFHHAVGPAEVFAMSITPGYQEKKCADAGALHWEVDVRIKDDDTAVVKAKRKMPTAGFPSLLRKIVPSGVTSTETVSWGPADADGSRVAKVHVDFHGAPARMNGELRLAPDSDGGSTIVIDADFSVPIPIVGRKAEQLAAPIILSVIESEERTAEQWVAGIR
jgi:hypothetical protein